MTQKNTNCKKCYFAKETTNHNDCVFGIPSAIKNLKKITVIDNYNYIENYTCRYGISQDVYNTKIKDMNIDIEDYARTRAKPKYILYVHVTGNDINLENVCFNITKLNVTPTKVKISFNKEYDRKNAVAICEKLLPKSYEWKLHYFMDKQDDANMLKASLATDNPESYAQFVWILNEQILNYAVKFNLDQKINYIINVNQPDFGLLHTKQTTDYFYGSFITVSNLNVLLSNKEYTIGEIIKHNFINNLTYYD